MLRSKTDVTFARERTAKSAQELELVRIALKFVVRKTHGPAGANALKIMKELGVYDELLAATPNPGECNIRGFRYVFGTEGHEEIYRVYLPKRF